MHLCQFIKVIANNTAKKIPKEYPHQHIFLATVALMPLYSEIGALDLWEKDCQDACIQKGYKPLSDDMEKLIEGIFELARTNLYTAYNQNHVEMEWLALRKQFIEQHIAFPDYYDFGEW